MNLTGPDALHTAGEMCEELLELDVDAGGWGHTDTADLVAVATVLSGYAQAAAAGEAVKLAEAITGHLANLADQVTDMADKLADLAASVERARWAA